METFIFQFFGGLFGGLVGSRISRNSDLGIFGNAIAGTVGGLWGPTIFISMIDYHSGGATIMFCFGGVFGLALQLIIGLLAYRWDVNRVKGKI